jgi:superfamily II DNA helicase RecQ
MQEGFVEYNKLVRPQVIKESTNRPNIRYVVTREKGAGTLVEKAARLVQSCWPRKDLFNHRQDKIILYCRTRDEAGQLADLLGCLSYTSKSGSKEEKKAIITQWLSTVDQPAIAATSALGPRFDYPHVR